MVRSWRERVAGRFGRVEHEAGRLIVVPILASGFFVWFRVWDWALFSVGLVFLLWLVYLVSHSLEKRFYGFGRRRL